ncbi:FAD synthetase, chloroplastic [Galdieria sulphuraria]|nr:FAD synthetase, chloroplastic [Galdieria sulphuraria]
MKFHHTLGFFSYSLVFKWRTHRSWTLSGRHKPCCYIERVRCSVSIAVPGKWDAFHIGHRRLVEVASTLGTPVLVTFENMASLLGWPSRQPLVAREFAPRILSSWEEQLSVVPITMQVIPFERVRYMRPQAFLDFLRLQLGCEGLVCGEDWRFGYGAQGDIHLLKKYCAEYNWKCCIVGSVYVYNILVSSTAVRHYLGKGQMETVSLLLGRPYCVIGKVVEIRKFCCYVSQLINQVPVSANYEAIIEQQKHCYIHVINGERGDSSCIRIENCTWDHSLQLGQPLNIHIIRKVLSHSIYHFIFLIII